ncbi:hypothetical protein QCA50_005746 [Cerrena zonata]|uniref:Uncharacterized protein n=1 Tax=Cerrena zonata TaxID=2478898 RepID=A0AAW0GG16_9APHY
MPKEPMLIDNITVNDSGDGHGERRPGLFTDILKNSPGSAASLLKRFHKQKHSKRFHLAAEVAACGYEAQSESSPNPNDQMDKFLSSKLPVVLIEIASESSLYKWWGEDDDITASFSVYASNIISALAGCVGYLQKLHWSYHAHYTDLPCLRELVDASEKLWTTLWNKRKLLFPFPEEIDAMGLRARSSPWLSQPSSRSNGKVSESCEIEAHHGAT